MKTVTYQYEKTFLIITGVLVAAFFVFFMGFRNKSVDLSQNEIQQINYEMAKAKSSGQLYSLDGREIDREMIELENEKHNAQSVKNTQAADKAKKDAKADKDKAAQNQQKANADKTQNKAQNKTQSEAGRGTRSGAAQTAQAKSSSALGDKELTRQMQEAQPNFAQNYYAQQQQQANNQNTTKDPVENKELKSIEEWKTEILASGNKETILKFVSAYNKKEVSQSEFYSFVESLMKSDDTTKVGLGLYALRATPSYASYVLLVSNQQHMVAQYQKYIDETLVSYNQPAFLGVLKQALLSQNKSIILKTIEVVKKGIQEIKSGSSAQLVDARNRRDNSITAFSLQQYNSFVPVINQLTALSQQNGDQEVYQASLQLNQTLQSNATVAAAF